MSPFQAQSLGDEEMGPCCTCAQTQTDRHTNTDRLTYTHEHHLLGKKDGAMTAVAAVWQSSGRMAKRSAYRTHTHTKTSTPCTPDTSSRQTHNPS